MDMREKLLPIFIKEAAKNISVLQNFLQGSALSQGDPNEIEAAYRAAHTLMGTARLVQVDSVHQLGRRIEVLLERHFTAQTRLTAVECEALELAIGWLNYLLADLQAGHSGSSVLIADTLTALELATRFPGRTPLVELLDSVEQLRAPHLNDPFAADPDLLLADEDILRLANDPFADDPSLGFGFNFFPDPLALLSQPDPLGTSVAVGTAAELPADRAADSPVNIPFDPFADDKSFLETEDSLSITVVENLPSDNQPAELPLQLSVKSSNVALPLPSDPFADDSVFDDSCDPLEPPEATIPPAATKAASRLKEIADWMLLPNQAAGSERLYVCCCFELSGQKYYFSIEHVLEIAELPPLLPLPLAPSFICGLINLRGQVMPVIDFSLLAQQTQSATAVRRLIIVQHQKEKLAFLADGIPYLSEQFSGTKIDLPEFIKSHQIRGAAE